MLLSYYSRAAAHAATEGLAEGHDRVHLFNPASAPANCTARFVKWGVDLIERLEQGELGEGMQLWSRARWRQPPRRCTKHRWVGEARVCVCGWRL